MRFFRAGEIYFCLDQRSFSRGMKRPPCTARAMKAQKRPVFVSYQSLKGTRVDVVAR